MNRNNPVALSATPSYHHEMAVPGGASGRTVTDLVTTAGAPTITSATANFTSADVGRYVKHSYNGDYRYIISVQSSTAATLSGNANTTATGVTGTIHGEQFYDKAFYGSVDPATGIYYCIANDNSGAGSRSGLFVLPGVGQPLTLVQTFLQQITGEMYIGGGYIHSHTITRPLLTLG
jgi:hypothetical protein